MKLFRFGQQNDERPGVLWEGRHLDITAFGRDLDEEFFDNDGLHQLKSWLTQNAKNCKEIPKGIRLAPPVKKPSKIVCVGLNYSNHAKESGMQIPSEPVIFFKSTTAICGPNDDLILPRGSKKTDWEVELALVIGKKASYIKEENAMDYLAGYVLHNDYSERGFQLEQSGQWVKGKSCDTFAPIGPYLVTKDEIEDPHKLDLWLKVNGELMQKSNTSDFVFNIPFVIAYISRFMSLLPCDIISTGTPAGVGLGFNPPKYLKDGDVVELGIDGLGTSKQFVKNYPG